MGFGVFLVHPTMVSVLVSTTVERCFVSPMRDFFLLKSKIAKTQIVMKLKTQRGIACFVFGIFQDFTDFWQYYDFFRFLNGFLDFFCFFVFFTLLEFLKFLGLCYYFFGVWNSFQSYWGYYLKLPRLLMDTKNCQKCAKTFFFGFFIDFLYFVCIFWGGFLIDFFKDFF